jgi:molecular chaperone IbpA
MTSTLIPSLFDLKKLDPFTVGYDKFFTDLQDLAKNAAKNVSYPPYNIKAVGKDKYVIEMAVAGFAKTDIEISLQGNKLTVEGATQEEELSDTQEFIFKGIANRNFTRTFNLADKIEIKDAEIVNGMLKIWLDSLVETQANIKKIAIK